MRCLFCSLLVVAFTIAPVANAKAENRSAKSSDLLLSYAIGLRDRFAFAPELADRHLQLVPKTSFNEDPTFVLIERQLWQTLMRGALVKIGYMTSETPVVLYYNAILDIGVLTVWRRLPLRYDLISMRAVPGATLGRASAIVGLEPPWRSADNPIVELRANTRNRLAAFSKTYPLSGKKAISPASPIGKTRVLAQELSEARMLAHSVELLSAAKDQTLAMVIEALDRQIKTSEPSTSALGIVSTLPDAVRATLEVAVAIPSSANSWYIFFRFPQYPTRVFVAASNGNVDNLEIQQVILP